jgi:hypothetical protein
MFARDKHTSLSFLSISCKEIKVLYHYLQVYDATFGVKGWLASGIEVCQDILFHLTGYTILGEADYILQVIDRKYLNMPTWHSAVERRFEYAELRIRGCSYTRRFVYSIQTRILKLFTVDEVT